MAKKITKKEITKKDLLNKTIAEVNKNFGKNTIISATQVKTKERIPFGLKELDELTGGGVTCCNFQIVFGPEATGKTQICYHLIAECQLLNKVACLIDLEHSFSPERATLAGVDLKELLVIEDISHAEEAMNIIKKLARNKVIDLVVVDSIQALSPKEEQESKKGVDRPFEEFEIAALAKKMDKFFRTTANFVFKSKMAVVLIGQTRTDIGSFGGPQICTGGKAKDFWSVMTLNIRRSARKEWPTKSNTEKIVDDEGKEHKKTTKKVIGFLAIIKLNKTKISGTKTEGSETSIKFLHETGFENDSE